MGLGMSEMIIIFLIILLLFGARRLPEVAKAMGKAVSEFKHAKDEILNAPVDVAAPKKNQPIGDSSTTHHDA